MINQDFNTELNSVIGNVVNSLAELQSKSDQEMVRNKMHAIIEDLISLRQVPLSDNNLHDSENEKKWLGDNKENTFLYSPDIDVYDGGGGIDRLDFKDYQLPIYFRQKQLPDISPGETEFLSNLLKDIDMHFEPQAIFNFRDHYIKTLAIKNDGFYEWKQQNIANIEDLSSGKTDDLIIGDADHNTISSGDGDDVIKGGVGDDNLYGRGGNDYLYGDEGDDYLYGHDGDDELHGGEGRDQLISGVGNDYLYGDEGDDYLYGGEGKDQLNGGDGDDELHGGEGHDSLHGGAGDDMLHGGKGSDWLDGGSGRDIFIFYKGEGDDWVMDFTIGEDILQIQNEKYRNFNDLQEIMSQDGSYVTLNFGDDDQVRLSNVQLTQLTQDEFNFI